MVLLLEFVRDDCSPLSFILLQHGDEENDGKIQKIMLNKTLIMLKILKQKMLIKNLNVIVHRRKMVTLR